MMVSSICFGVVFFGKYFFSLLVLIFKVSFWLPFSSVIIANIVSMSSRPLWLNCFFRCACESEGVASSLSIVAKRFSCSSFFKKDSSTAGVRAIFPSSRSEERRVGKECSVLRRTSKREENMVRRGEGRDGA